MSLYASRVLKNGNIITVDKDCRIAEAVALYEDRIVAVGSWKQLEPYIGEETEVTDLKGKTVIPGINDSHMHLSIAGLRCMGYSEREYLYPDKQWTFEEKKNAVTAALTYLSSLGVTSITDGEAGTRGRGMRGGIADEDIIYILNDLKNEGKLPVRVNLLLSYGNQHNDDSPEYIEKMLPQLGFHNGFGDAYLRVSGLKLFADGSPMGGNACMWEPYRDGHNAPLKIMGDNDTGRYDSFMRMIRFAHRHGFTTGIHCTGDRAIDAVADGFLLSQSDSDWNSRDYFIHGELISDDTIEKVQGKGFGYSALLSALWLNGGPDAALGEKRGSGVFPLRKAMEAGLTVTGHTDYPFLPADWRCCIEAAVTRKTKDGKIVGEDQAVSLREALEMFTINGAWQTHEEKVKGSVEPGKFADLCILDRDILSIPKHLIHEVQILETIIGGKTVYQKS